MANAGVRSKREVLLDTGYFVEKGILSDDDTENVQSLGNESKSTTDLFGR